MKKKILFGIFVIIIVSVISYFIYETHKDYVMEVITIKNENNQNIYGELYKPRSGKKFPLVIYAHGLGATYRAGIDYAKEMAKYGIATYTFDFRGGSDRSKSDGSTKEMSFLTEMEDLETIIAKVKEWNFVDKDNIILMGSSQGGAISALVSSTHNDDIKGTVLLYPALGIPAAVQNRYENLDSIAKEIKMTDNITVGRKYFEDIFDMNVYEMIQNDTKKILILQGSKDTLVNPEHSKKVNNIYTDSELYIIEGAEHGFDGKYFDEAVDHIINYFKDIKVINKKEA